MILHYYLGSISSDRCYRGLKIEHGTIKFYINIFALRARYFCDDGYLLTHTTENVCRADIGVFGKATWRNTPPKCVCK